MSTVQEIEAAISRLSPEEYSHVRDWLLDHDNELWDKQIEADCAAGKLDHLVGEIEDDIAAGRVKPLDEIIHDT